MIAIRSDVWIEDCDQLKDMYANIISDIEVGFCDHWLNSVVIGQD